ncbi:MAG: tRNA (adenosine(37)-N6)-dimethylallyltransferase MiaA [Bacilli bacterium]|nr:tRNA (adenosine(37)-N6)-dimethylallyltransferase MiaA [Bacilli bacterium]
MIIVIIGPTGIGKTKLSLALAKHYQTDIISGDSVQVYRKLNIGSAKISENEMQGITHHCLNLLEPTEEFSVALYQKIVREKIEQLNQANKMPLIVGGTGLYIKSVLYDYNFVDTLRNQELVKVYEKYQSDELHKLLMELDYESSLEIHPNNRKRVIQAIIRADKNKVSENKNKDVPLYDFLIIGLTTDRNILYEIINKRVDRMFEEGLLEEVRALYEQGVHSNSVNSIGYKELYSFFDGEISFQDAVDKIKQHSRNLAKRQYTFFNNQLPVKWINVDFENFDNTIEEVITLIESNR